MKNTSEELDDSYKVPNLEKGILILELLAYANRGMTLQEIKNEAGSSQTTTYRILNTLVRMGYLLYSKTSKKYKLSRKILILGFQTIQEHNLLEVVLPKMRELRNIVKETVCFGVMGTEKGLFIEQVLGTHPFCFVLSPGKSFDLHCSAPGKAMMAFMSEESRKNYLSKMNYQIYNKNTISSEEVYLKELEKVRKLGYAVDMEEELNGVVCVGAPVFNYSKAPCGTIWISGPKDRLSEETILMFANEILNITHSISFDLGYNNS
ncbi:MAG: IclR family transcriptional regulator [Dysgonamonadaceae bacterium]|jgi:DNA-binding IclR family transcriptional regulator|nr:IclR family transcriptional regulator [Dysgonamonadaceae bacterium]